MTEYISDSVNLSNELIFENLYIKDPIVNKNISIFNVISDIKKIIPKHFFSNIDDIFIGIFSEFDDRNIQSFYKERTIYISNILNSEEDYIKNIIHEISHSVEEFYHEKIYSDFSLEDEFLSKREKLEYHLNSYGIKTKKYNFQNTEYDENFDKFLYKTIGYDKLYGLSESIFLSPYSITSISEYFANGFENYYLHNNLYLLKMSCPILFLKIEELLY